MKKLATSEFDEEDVGFENLSSRNKAKKIIIALTVVLFLVFVVCLVFIVLFAVEKSKVQEQAAGETKETPSLQKICDSRKCLFASLGKFNLLPNYFTWCQFRFPTVDIEIKGVRELFIVERHLTKKENRVSVSSGLFIQSSDVCFCQDLKKVNRAYQFGKLKRVQLTQLFEVYLFHYPFQVILERCEHAADKR